MLYRNSSPFGNGYLHHYISNKWFYYKCILTGPTRMLSLQLDVMRIYNYYNAYVALYNYDLTNQSSTSVSTLIDILLVLTIQHDHHYQTYTYVLYTVQ